MSARTGFRRLAHAAATVAVLCGGFAAYRLFILWELRNMIDLHLPTYAAGVVAIIAGVAAWALYGFAKRDE